MELLLDKIILGIKGSFVTVIITYYYYVTKKKKSSSNTKILLIKYFDHSPTLTVTEENSKGRYIKKQAHFSRLSSF